MDKGHIPSLKTLAGLDNPFENIETQERVESKLLGESCEGRYLERKLCGLFRKESSKRTKYRVVKAIISFANTAGGFILFGVDNDGKVIGLTKEEVREFDPAKVTELVNSCITPDITEFNLYFFTQNKKRIAVLHVPPSKLMPHVTTKEVFEQVHGQKRVVFLARYALYCRYGAKSDIARPADYERILTRRTNFLREELLRRFKEVTISKPTILGRSREGSNIVVRVAKDKKHGTGPVVTLTRKAGEANGIFLHEALDEGLFNVINNVVDANELLAKGHQKFVFGKSIYYRIYAERQYVTASDERIEILAHAGFNFYAPVLYWLLHLPTKRVAGIMKQICTNPKNPQAYFAIKVAILLGSDASNWLEKLWDRKWFNYAQPPSYYYTLKKMKNMIGKKDNRLIVLGSGVNKPIILPENDQAVSARQLLESPTNAASVLSKYCMLLFQDKSDTRDICRKLDVLAYGNEINARANEIVKLLTTS